MKVTEFAKEVTLAEGLKKQISIAQVMEVMKVINILLCGTLYKDIRSIK